MEKKGTSLEKTLPKFSVIIKSSVTIIFNELISEENMM